MEPILTSSITNNSNTITSTPLKQQVHRNRVCVYSAPKFVPSRKISSPKTLEWIDLFEYGFL